MEKKFICREMKKWNKDPESQLAFNQLSSLGKTKVTSYNTSYHDSSSWGFLTFLLALYLALMRVIFEDILFHLGGFMIKNPVELQGEMAIHIFLTR